MTKEIDIHECPCCLTKVQLLDRILRISGVERGKSKYGDGQVTKEEVITIYKYLLDKADSKDIKKIRW